MLLFIIIILVFIICVLFIYYLFFNLFSIFFYNIDIYKNFEYIVNKADNTDENYNYYILLNEEKTLKNNIDEYNQLTNKYEYERETLILNNRNLLNIKTVVENDIAIVDKLINDINAINNGSNDQLLAQLTLEQYKLLFKSIYSFYLIIDDLYTFMNINNYKIIFLKNYINNILINDMNCLNYINVLRKTYILNMLLKDKN